MTTVNYFNDKGKLTTSLTVQDTTLTYFQDDNDIIDIKVVSDKFPSKKFVSRKHRDKTELFNMVDKLELRGNLNYCFVDSNIEPTKFVHNEKAAVTSITLNALNDSQLSKNLALALLAGGEDLLGKYKVGTSPINSLRLDVLQAKFDSLIDEVIEKAISIDLDKVKGS